MVGVTTPGSPRPCLAGHLDRSPGARCHLDLRSRRGRPPFTVRPALCRRFSPPFWRGPGGPCCSAGRRARNPAARAALTNCTTRQGPARSRHAKRCVSLIPVIRLAAISPMLICDRLISTPPPPEIELESSMSAGRIVYSIIAVGPSRTALRLSIAGARSPVTARILTGSVYGRNLLTVFSEVRTMSAAPGRGQTCSEALTRIRFSVPVCSLFLLENLGDHAGERPPRPPSRMRARLRPRDRRDHLDVICTFVARITISTPPAAHAPRTRPSSGEQLGRYPLRTACAAPLSLSHYTSSRNHLLRNAPRSCQHLPADPVVSMPRSTAPRCPPPPPVTLGTSPAPHHRFLVAPTPPRHLSPTFHNPARSAPSHVPAP